MPGITGKIKWPKTNMFIPGHILIHILFWIAVWFFYVYFFSYNSDDRAYVMWFSSLLMPVTIINTYFTVNRLIPRFLLKKKYPRFILYNFYVFVITSYLIAVIIYSFLFFFLGFNVTAMPPMSKNFFFILILVYIVVGIVSSVSILKNNFDTVSRNRELQNKILSTRLQLKEQELNYLRSQIHPHFLFNTLNTIYGLALQKSRQTPDVILRLSSLLDYILYRVNKPEVSLKEEISHVKEYIELEKIRFEDNLAINFRSDNIPGHTAIAPMILIPLVENAFKHGGNKNGELNIDIDIAMDGDSLVFKIANSYMQKVRQTGNSGIGIENTRKRLEYNYENNFLLEREINENTYIVNLAIYNLKRIENE